MYNKTNNLEEVERVEVKVLYKNGNTDRINMSMMDRFLGNTKLFVQAVAEMTHNVLVAGLTNKHEDGIELASFETLKKLYDKD
jgi:hypothetical protein